MNGYGRLTERRCDSKTKSSGQNVDKCAFAPGRNFDKMRKEVCTRPAIKPAKKYTVGGKNFRWRQGVSEGSAKKGSLKTSADGAFFRSCTSTVQYNIVKQTEEGGVFDRR